MDQRLPQKPLAKKACPPVLSFEESIIALHTSTILDSLCTLTERTNPTPPSIPLRKHLWAVVLDLSDELGQL